ncbi:ABC-type transport auxiliary lipoprotein family protein [Ramlibacter algicola]|uniref:Membrane integrity-associated transporter subunit PqiC n=1 Tax=Ramlibacter algicola TaxID=2795217 RepID=A0A934PXF9_9BURK|nr:ABC-type transport auxiliary lipoprotein family protein [Ramlibacter algicola]MBK0391138.1 membrane integrity-associated transporter subunit PqiC [Ramlibacter algicola]
MIRLHRLAWVALALLLGGCAGFVDKPQRPVLFDMGPLPPLVAPAAKPEPRVAVVVPDIEASGALDSSAILYRLGYSDDHQLRAYSQSRWTAPPPQLVRQRLRQQLGRERPVLSADESAALGREGLSAIYILRLELEEFAQVFDSEARSRGVIRLRATLLANTTGGEQLVGQRSIAVEGESPTPDASGGVRAMTAATDAAAADISLWLRQVRETK